MRADVANASVGAPVPTMPYAFSEASVLRYVAGACESVLAAAYVVSRRYAYELEVNNGVPRKTAHAMSILFGRQRDGWGDDALCQEALALVRPHSAAGRALPPLVLARMRNTSLWATFAGSGLKPA